ncbi:uncharacterized protein KQ657_004895 [Scheffersomyces spartinae]|uniref:MICOS complex subunit MIC12 n=1 Tax=Scheffersomyces spartinae TaxID=45513 RepID=A0A9P7VAI0_9ASCO|nr:uncharacterized protein KQ657_004895 [Scheffersomyces spartinae]KAG7194185.1 hypothetical protein KQ657_004895 [Scheffersomyces spartinae]
MAGRIHGFLSGVLLTSAITYYTGEYIKKNQQFVSRHLQTSTRIIDNRILSDKDINKDIEPGSSHITRTSRGEFKEICKDIWNDEIITMVNWIYSINWFQLGKDADEGLIRLTDNLSEKISKH